MSQNKTSDSKLPDGNKLPHYAEVKEEILKEMSPHYKRYIDENNSDFDLDDLIGKVMDIAIRKTQEADKEEIRLRNNKTRRILEEQITELQLEIKELNEDNLTIESELSYVRTQLKQSK